MGRPATARQAMLPVATTQAVPVTQLAPVMGRPATNLIRDAPRATVLRETRATAREVMRDVLEIRAIVARPLVAIAEGWAIEVGPLAAIVAPWVIVAAMLRAIAA